MDVRLTLENAVFTHPGKYQVLFQGQYATEISLYSATPHYKHNDFTVFAPVDASLIAAGSDSDVPVFGGFTLAVSVKNYYHVGEDVSSPGYINSAHNDPISALEELILTLPVSDHRISKELRIYSKPLNGDPAEAALFGTITINYRTKKSWQPERLKVLNEDDFMLSLSSGIVNSLIEIPFNLSVTVAVPLGRFNSTLAQFNLNNSCGQLMIPIYSAAFRENGLVLHCVDQTRSNGDRPNSFAITIRPDEAKVRRLSLPMIFPWKGSDTALISCDWSTG